VSDHSGTSASTYARRVGERLRAIRRQKALSLQEVEAISDHEFKASVLGAYERGERVISVPRLQRLARLYLVPVDQLLPSGADAAPAGTGDGVVDDGVVPPRRAPAWGGPSPDKITFDLTRFDDVDDAELAMVYRYLKTIMVQRQDFNGRVLTIRGDDIRAIAGLFGVEPGELTRRLDDQHLRVHRGADLAGASSP
jgi:transcriptional regulator with XRE-family HTH domain